MKARRGRLEVSTDILAVALNRMSERRIISKAKVNCDKFRKYLLALIENELIALDNSNGDLTYRTMNKGILFFKFINDTKKIILS